MSKAAFAIDRQGRIVSINDDAECLFGVSAPEVMGRPYGVAFTDDPGWRGLHALVTSARSVPGKIRRARLDIPGPGAPRHFRMTARVVQDSTTGRPTTVAFTIKDITESVRAWRRRTESGFFRQFLLATCGVGIVANGTIASAISVESYSVLVAWAYLLAILVPVAVLLRQIPQPLETCGLTLSNWKTALREGLVLSSILVPFAVALALARHAADGRAGFSSLSLPDLIDHNELEVLALLYLPHVFLQEFVARGVLQTGIARLIGDPSGWRSVALAAGLFGVHHFYLGVLAVLLTFVSGLLFGWIYRRHGNLIGVTLVHFSVGWTAYMFNLL